MAGEQEVEVVAYGMVWAIALGDDGVTHAIRIDRTIEPFRAVWTCRGTMQSLWWLEQRARVCAAGTPITCIDCIAIGVP